MTKSVLEYYNMCRDAYQHDIKKIDLVCTKDGKVTGKTNTDISALKFLRAPRVFDMSYYNKVEGMALSNGYIVTPRDELEVCEQEQIDKELVTAQFAGGNYKLEINMDNAAFEEPEFEVSRILSDLAQEVQNSGIRSKPLHDINGNTVGQVWME